MSRRPTHKIKATGCGGARKGDGLSADWDRVDCPGCLASYPGRRPSVCQHCRRFIRGSCAPLHLDATDRWLHADCIGPFQRSPEGQAILAAHPTAFESPKCPTCGVPGGHDGEGGGHCWQVAGVGGPSDR